MLGEAGRDSRSARGAKRRMDREHRSFRGGRGRGRGGGRGRGRGRSVGEQPDRLGVAAAEAADAAAAGHARALDDLALEARRRAGAVAVRAAPETAGWEAAGAAAAEQGRHALPGAHAHLAAAVAALPLPARLLVDGTAATTGDVPSADYATAVRLVVAAAAPAEAHEPAPEAPAAPAVPEAAPPVPLDADAAAEEALDELLAM